MKKQIQQSQENNNNSIEIDNLVSVPLGGKFLQGVVKDITDDTLTIENYGVGEVKIPNNDLVYKFFPGQKFDLREFNSIDESMEPPISLRQKLDSFLSKTEYKSLDGLLMKEPKTLGQLLAGKLTSEMFKGSSLIQREGESAKEKVDWQAKFQLYRGKDKNLKLNVQFHEKELKKSVYGQDVTEEQFKQMKEDNKTITLERKTKEGKDFKVFAKYDKKLNRFVTSPYSEAIEQRMIKSASKKEEQKNSNAKKETKAIDLTKKKATSNKRSRAV